MISQSAYNTSQIFNKVSIEILSELFNSERALTIYELNKRYSYRQYQYMLKRLESSLVVNSYKHKKKKYFRLNHFYRELVRSVLEIKKWEETNDYSGFPQSLSYDEKFFRVISALKGIKGWAFTDSTALLLWVPFLDLQLPFFTVCVRDRYLKSKLEDNFPPSVLRVQLQANFFSQKSNITFLNEVPVLKPELLVFRLLGNENKRISLSSLFLLPFLSPKTVLRFLEKNKNMFPSMMYFLLALEKVLNKNTELSVFLKQWFLNFDHFDTDLLFSRYLRQIGKRGMREFKPTTFKRFELMRIKQQQQSNQWTEWDRLGMLFHGSSGKFEPSDLTELIISSPPSLPIEV